MDLYVVKRVYGCGWRCSKASFDVSSEIESINKDMLIAISGFKRSALDIAYLESIKMLDEDDLSQINTLNLDNCKDSEIEEWLEKVKEFLVGDEMYCWIEIVKMNMIE
jgi:hypothetical protein